MKADHQAMATGSPFIEKNTFQTFVHFCQAPIKVIELINALKSCQSHEQAEAQSLEDARSQGASLEPTFIALVAHESQAVEEEIYFQEQVLLREIGFNLVVKSSHKYLLNFAKSLQLKAHSVRLAVFLCNDSLVYTSTCLKFEATEIAAACIQASLLLSKTDPDLLKYTIAGLLGLSREKVHEITNAVIDMLVAQKQDSHALDCQP